MLSITSPICNIDRTFTTIFFLTPKTPIKDRSYRKYKNPIYLAKEYKRMIEPGEVKNQSGLAEKLGISRAHVSQVLTIQNWRKN